MTPDHQNNTPRRRPDRYKCHACRQSFEHDRHPSHVLSVFDAAEFDNRRDVEACSTACAESVAASLLRCPAPGCGRTHRRPDKGPQARNPSPYCDKACQSAMQKHRAHARMMKAADVPTYADLSAEVERLTAALAAAEARIEALEADEDADQLAARLVALAEDWGLDLTPYREALTGPAAAYIDGRRMAEDVATAVFDLRPFRKGTVLDDGTLCLGMAAAAVECLGLPLPDTVEPLDTHDRPTLHEWVSDEPEPVSVEPEPGPVVDVEHEPEPEPEAVEDPEPEYEPLAPPRFTVWGPSPKDVPECSTEEIEAYGKAAEALFEQHPESFEFIAEHIWPRFGREYRLLDRHPLAHFLPEPLGGPWAVGESPVETFPTSPLRDLLAEIPPAYRRLTATMRSAQ